MNSLDSFKHELHTALKEYLPDHSLVNAILATVEHVAKGYSIIPLPQHPEPERTYSETLEEYLTSKAVEEKSKGTLKTYRSYLSAFLRFAGKPVTEISTKDIRNYISFCKEQKHYKDNSLETTRRCINSFFDFCLTEEITRNNPCKRIKPIKHEKKSRTSMKLIELEYIRRSCRTLREKALVDFLYSTGCRVSEVSKCRVKNIDWEKKSILIELGKGKVTRTTFINTESEVSLKAYLAVRESENDYIFARDRGKSSGPLSVKCIQDIVRKVVARSGKVETHVTPHVFRHTVATVAIHNGMPVEHVQKMLGHANINTTMIYAEVGNEDVRISHQKFLAA